MIGVKPAYFLPQVKACAVQRFHYARNLCTVGTVLYQNFLALISKRKLQHVAIGHN